MVDYALSYLYQSLLKDMWLKSGHKLNNHQKDIVYDYVLTTYAFFIMESYENIPLDNDRRKAIKTLIDLCIDIENKLYTNNSKELDLLLNSDDKNYLNFEYYRGIISIMEVILTNKSLQDTVQIDGISNNDAIMFLCNRLNEINDMTPECKELARKEFPIMVDKLANCYDKIKSILKEISIVSTKLNTCRSNVYLYIYNILLKSNPDIDKVTIHNFIVDIISNMDYMFNFEFVLSTYDNMSDESINKLGEDIINIIMILINSYNKLRGDFQ